MSKLTKEEVISKLQEALSQQQKQSVTIEQKGSWYKIDGGKSVRFSELETMLNEMTSATPVTSESVKTTKVVVPATVAQSNKGKTPKQLWREKLAAQKGKTTLPRGF